VFFSCMLKDGESVFVREYLRHTRLECEKSIEA
jgi:hypothetical protein